MKILVFVALAHFCLRTLVDPDIWWHIRNGLDIMTSGSLVPVDRYTFTIFGQKWINPEWLSELIFAFCFSKLGAWPALVILKGMLALLILYVCYRSMDKWQLNLVAKSLALIVVAIFLSPAINAVRPHLFSCLFISLELMLLRDGLKFKRIVSFLPLIFIFWVNLHGGFLLGLAVLAAFLGLELIFNFSSLRLGQALIILFTCVLAIMINPVTYAMPLHVMTMLRDLYPDVSEWQPIKLVSELGIFWILINGVVIWSYFNSTKEKSLTNTIIYCCFAIAPLMAIRHVQFYGIATIMLMGEYLSAIWHNLAIKKNSANNVKEPKSVIYICEAVSLVAAIFICNLTVQNISITKLTPPEVMPEKALGIMQAIEAHGNCITEFDWGAYLSWHLPPPRLKVSIDSRMDAAFPFALKYASHFFETGIGPWDFLLKNYQIDIILIRKKVAAYNLMKLYPGWKCVYEDDDTALFFPTSSPQCQRAEQFMEGLAKGQYKMPKIPLI